MTEKRKKKTVFAKDIALEFVTAGPEAVAEKIKAKAYTRSHIEDAAKALRSPPINKPDSADAILALLPAKRPPGKVYLSDSGETLRRASSVSEIRSLIRVTADAKLIGDGTFWLQETTETTITLRRYTGPVTEQDDDDGDDSPSSPSGG